jgi:CHAD domain-containing protein
MAYRLDPRESLPRGIRRIYAEQLEGAVGGLRGAEGDERDAAVHDARKRIKKSRAVLRLVRDEVGKKTYKQENRALRDVGRKLSDARDAAVLVETVERLGEHVPLARRSLGPLHQVLEARRQEAVGAVVGAEGAMADAADELERILARADRWSLEGDDFSVLEKGVKRSYGRGRDGFAAARSKSTDERMHEARKHVKDLWYHTRILKPVWPGPMDQLVDATDRLADILGEDHDLAVLAETVRTLADDGEDGGAGETALVLIDNRRAELRAEIWPLGRRVYADRPKAFTRRLRALYRIWREENVWQLSPQGVERVRKLLTLMESGTPAEQRRVRDQLRRQEGIGKHDLEQHLPARNGSPTRADFEELLEAGRVRVVTPEKQKS